MTSEGTNGKTPENVGDDVVDRPIGEQEESLGQNVSEDETASDAAQILPMLQNLLLNNDTQRERLTALFQLYDPAAENTNANVTTESEQTAREAELSSQVHFLEQSVQKLEEELENQKKLTAQLEEQIESLTNSRDP